MKICLVTLDHEIWFYVIKMRKISEIVKNLVHEYMGLISNLDFFRTVMFSKTFEIEIFQNISNFFDGKKNQNVSLGEKSFKSGILI